MSKPDRSERNWVLVWAVAIVLLASVPYLWGACLTPTGYRFLGLTQNIDDGAVYLSWTRQAADGHLFMRNLFTNEAQSGRQINVLFLLIGGFARLTGISCLGAYHLFRVLLGIGLLYMVWRFAALALAERRERLLLIPLVGLSSGIGWLIPHVQSPVGSVDVWQPEAITFLSLYLNPLFLAGLILMLGSFCSLLLAEETGRARYAVWAGVCLLLLGNIHSYDVLTVACVWIAYLVVRAILDRKLPLRTISLSFLAALIASPAIAYQFYIYRIDEVFRLRANTPTPSPPIWSFFEGYGLVLVAAIAGAVLAMRNAECGLRSGRALLVTWAIVGFAVPYIPIAQQRKLVMGLHIPLCILAAIAISWLIGRTKCLYGVLIAAVFIALTFQTNKWFIELDMKLLGEGRTVTSYAPYMTVDQINAMQWAGEHSEPGDTFFCDPQVALFLPAFADRQVYYGHWSETPDYERKSSEWVQWIDPLSQRGVFRAAHISYVISAERIRPEAGLKVATFGDLSIYKVLR